MADVMLPPGLKIANIEWRYLESGGNTASPYTGAIRTRNLGGDRLACTIGFTIAKDADRAALISFVGALRGQTNRALIIDSSHTIRGSFPTGELFSNADFSNGTAGWSVNNGAISVSNGVLRLQSTYYTPPELYQSAALAQYAPHALRSVSVQGRGSLLSALQICLSSGVAASTVPSNPRGYAVLAGVGLDGSAQNQYPVFLIGASGGFVGDYIGVPFASLSRCFLVDGGSNGLLRSDEHDNAAWTKVRSSVTANSITAPDGTATGDALVEDGSNNTHYEQQNVTVTSAAQDLEFKAVVGGNTRTWCQLVMQETTGSTSVSAYINLSTGAVGTTATGANWSNLRVYVVALGSGWWQVHLIARKTNAATTVTQVILLATANGTNSYAGNGTSSIAVWRAGQALSSVPSRIRQTTTAAVAAETQKGTSFYVKGLPVSTAGLLLAGDWVEFIVGSRTFKREVISPLDSNAAGLGYLQVSPPVHFDVSDNSPIIVTRTVSRMVCVSAPPSWGTEPGLFSRVSLNFVESGD